MEARMTPEQARAALATMTDADFITVDPVDDVDDALVERLIEAAHNNVGRPSLTAPGKHSPRISFRAPQDDHDRLDAKVAKLGRTPSSIAREAFERGLDLVG